MAKLFCPFPTSVPSPIYFPSSPSPTISLSFKPIAFHNQRKPISLPVPPTDRVIDFGKYKGRMLGTLPSKYLKWVSKNLRARDFEEWAKLADQVLQHPLYRERLEWELAESILTGNDPRASRTQSPASDLLEISQRFGWDNEDRAAWSRIDFDLLGTSKGGRIPRIGSSEGRKSDLGSDGERHLGVSRNVSMDSSGMTSRLLQERKAGILKGRTRDRRIEAMSSMEKGLGLRRERKTGYSSRGSMDSPIEERTAGLDNRRKLGSLGRVSSYPRAEETNSSETSSKTWKDRKVGFLIEHSAASKVKISGFSDGRKVGVLNKGIRFYNEDEDEEEDVQEGIVRGRREDRRGRQRLKRNLQMQSLKKEVGVEEKRANGNTYQKIQNQNRQETLNPFPGREALLRKANRLSK